MKQPAPDDVMIVEGKKGRYRFSGGTAADESCTLARSGTFNVSRILRAIKTKTIPAKLFELPIDDGLIHHLRARDVDGERVAELSKAPDAALKRPGLFILEPDGTSQLVDGVHRVMALHRMRALTFLAWQVPLAALDPYKVRAEKWVNGAWVEIPGTGILEATRGKYAKGLPGGGWQPR